MTESRVSTHEFALPYAEQDLGRVAAPFTVNPSADGHGIVVAGACPRCHGRTSTEYRYGAPGTGTKGLRSWLAGRRPVPGLRVDAAFLELEPQFCECGHPHADLPQDAPFTGCGASWRIGTPATGAGS
ncbi:hypothetical protein ACFW40_18490 [Streptomyces sp. NPDC058807]|uniref:hypothetical protein n=1 Tax=unclassified Streptomyces TaxID=2593676 RepID=UPI0036BA2868